MRLPLADTLRTYFSKFGEVIDAVSVAPRKPFYSFAVPQSLPRTLSP